MADTTQLNLNVKRETKRRVAQIAQITNRKPGNVIDWVVDKVWAEMGIVQATTPEAETKTLIAEEA
jgi:uncharacterized protein YijF (DUF1287 family)